jgi:hypothetical protein
MGNLMRCSHREWREPWLPKGVRRIRLDSDYFQQRVNVGPKRIVPSINLGTYRTAKEAAVVGKKFRSLWATGMTPWEAITAMIASGDIPVRIRCRWYFMVPGGWAVKARKRGVEVHLPGPYASLRIASDAAGRELRRIVKVT